MRVLSCLVASALLVMASPARAEDAAFRMSGCWEQQQREFGYTICFNKTDIAGVSWLSASGKALEGLSDEWHWSQNGKTITFLSESDQPTVCEIEPPQPVDRFSLKNCQEGLPVSGPWVKAPISGYEDK